MATTTLQVDRTRSPVLYPQAQWYFLLAMATTWVGFSRTYFAVLPTEPLLHHVHGALMGGWIALLVVQPMLYQRGRLRLHRTLGRWGAFLLAPGVVICGFLMVRLMLRGRALPPFVVTQLAFLDVSSILLFALFVGLSIFYARTLELHARYIVCTVLLLVPPALTRALFFLPFMRDFQRSLNVSEGLMIVILMMLIVGDRRRGRVPAAYPIALAAFTTMTVASNFAGRWGWWHSLTQWIATTGA